ncbi:hypothetical protein Patl1_14776 [Pistacia atlantica]|uniref:Uncharacterized protein n=1 Tax=Pistacia atlantica TaxID=434234 RepID=A0ACC1AXK4_9ROSI|nr:hypothetical protein Patl1_14776 [Pistacia atlantica]
MARLLLSREEVNNLIATLLLRRNRQFISHHLHLTTIEKRMDSMPRMLRDMSIDALRELKGVSLDNDNINLNGGNNTQLNNPDDSNNEA